MEFMEVVILPLSPFGTPLKGDTLFGHFCWEVARDPDLLEGGLAPWVELYSERPFAVFSSAFPCRYEGGRILEYAFPAPPLPPDFGSELAAREKAGRLRQRKQNEEKVWIVLEGELGIPWRGSRKMASDGLFAEKAGPQSDPVVKPFDRHHNRIHRLYGRTAPRDFAPFTQRDLAWRPGTHLFFFALVDASATDRDRVACGVERIGLTGFGRDASTGRGRFQVVDIRSWRWQPPEGADAAYATAPVVPERDTYRAIYHQPFTRYGRLGDRLASSGNPFKNPVLMADEGAVLVPHDPAHLRRPYLGRALQGLAEVDDHPVIGQGFAPWLPMTGEHES